MGTTATGLLDEPVTIQTAESQAVELVQSTIAELTPYEQEAMAIEIHTDADYESVAATLLDTNARMKILNGKRMELVNPLNTVVEKINAMFRRPAALLDSVASILNGKLSGWRAHLKEEARKAEALAREQAAKEAERIRKEAEAAAKRMEKKGDTEGADAVRTAGEAMAAAMPIVLPPVAAPPKIAGMATRKNYKARVVNPAILPDSWWIKTIDQKGLNARAEQVKQVGPAPGIPGVEFYVEETSYGRGR